MTEVVLEGFRLHSINKVMTKRRCARLSDVAYAFYTFQLIIEESHDFLEKKHWSIMKKEVHKFMIKYYIFFYFFFRLLPRLLAKIFS